jgi:uncharacterized protein (DUF488 family)
MSLPFFTIGHSNRSLEAFVALLQEAGVTLIADVRRLPGSRANPQFDADRLQPSLALAQIGYEHIALLGGRRGKAMDVPQGLNGLWTNESFRNDADYALTESFQEGLRRLLDVGHEQRCALMCAEAVWWRCHRRIVADYLLARGETVFHIVGAGRIEPARLTAGAVVQPDGTILYSPETSH